MRRTIVECKWDIKTAITIKNEYEKNHSGM